MDRKWIAMVLSVACLSALSGASLGHELGPDDSGFPDKKMVLRLIGPNGKPVVGAQVGTGLNIFEESEGHPPQTITMWLRGQKRSWPFLSDSHGQVTLTGDDTDFRNFYAQHAAGGWAGYRRLQEGSASGRVVVRMEPACHVYGQLSCSDFDALGYPLAKTVAFLYDSRDRLVMYFVSERGRYEFLLPGGRYELECVGEGPGGIETERFRMKVDIAKGQRRFEVGSIDLRATRLAELFSKPAPELDSIANWRGEKPPRLARLQGNVVVLVFWGGWSRPCLQTMPQLIELHDMYAEKGLTIIAVHDNSTRTMAELEAEMDEARRLYWGRRDLPFPVGLDTGANRGAAHDAYGVSEWPTTIVIDRRGMVAGKLSPWGPLQRELPRLLGSK